MKILVIIKLRKSISCKESACVSRDRSRQEGTGLGGGVLSKILKWTLIIRLCFWFSTLHDKFVELSSQAMNLMI